MMSGVRLVASPASVAQPSCTTQAKVSIGRGHQAAGKLPAAQPWHHSRVQGSWHTSSTLRGGSRGGLLSGHGQGHGAEGLCKAGMTETGDPRGSISSGASASLPVLDVAELQNPEQRQAFLDKLRQTCHTVGFFYVINHGTTYGRRHQAQILRV